MKCYHCGKEIDISIFTSEIGKIKSKQKSKASAENGKKGGRSKEKKTSNKSRHDVAIIQEDL